MLDPGVFLDRDGTINEERHYLSSITQFRFIDGAVRAIRLLKESGFKVAIFTNQAGVARGYFSEKTLQHIHCMMEQMLRAQDAHIDAVYYCPHHPTEGVGAYRIECNCRKPKPGMLEKAERELKIDLSESWVVGDKVSDLEAGHAVGCRIVLVRTGYGLEAEEEFISREFQPDYVAADVLEASQWILKQESRHGQNVPPTRRCGIQVGRKEQGYAQEDPRRRCCGTQALTSGLEPGLYGPESVEKTTLVDHNLPLRGNGVLNDAGVTQAISRSTCGNRFMPNGRPVGSAPKRGRQRKGR